MADRCRVLVDNSVLSDGIIATSVSPLKTVQWGDIAVRVEVTGWKGMPAQPESGQWLREQIECLPTIAEQGRQGRIRLFTYSELRFERMHRSNGYNIFKDIHLETISPAVDRSRFFPADFEKAISGDETEAFVDWLLNLDLAAIDQILRIVKLPAFEETNLRGLARLRLICQRLSRKHWRDAFHLWTAEANQMDCFLMNEKRFRGALQGAGVSPLCPVFSPEELLDRLQIRNREPLPIEHEQLQDFFGRSLKT